MTKPKLRFKDKNGNAYPEWKTKRAEEIFKNKTIKNMAELPVLSVTQDRGTILREDCGINMKYDKTALNTYKLVNKGDFIISLRSFQGGLEYSDLDGIVSPAYTVLCPLININNAFYKYYLKTYNFICSLNIAVEGIRDGKQISYNSFKTIKLNYPCLEEQEKIARFLSKVDELINECEDEVKDLEEQKKGLMQKIFSQQIRFKDSNNNPYPDWEEKKLYDITDVRDGTHDSPKYVAYGYPLITSKNLTKDGKLDFSDVSYITEQDYKEINKRSKVHVGDILFGMIGTIGKPVVIQEDNFAIKNVALIKNNQNNINRYLVHYLQSDNILRQFHVEIAGGTQKFIALGLIRNLKIQIPCKEEQEKIAKVLSKMDELIEEKKALLSDWQQFKKGLLQQMFV